MLEISARIQPSPHDDSQAGNVMFVPGRDKVTSDRLHLSMPLSPNPIDGRMGVRIIVWERLK